MRSSRETGLAVPLVVLFFGALWLFPLITALVAGDIVASEDNNGTLKTILALGRPPQVFIAKASRRSRTVLVVALCVGLVSRGRDATGSTRSRRCRARRSPPAARST